MKFKLDENLPIEASVMLRDRGYDAHSVYDEQICGAADPSIAQICREEQRILLTMDLDFADIRRFPPSLHFGIIILRLERTDRDSVIAMIPRLLLLLQTEPVQQRLWVVDEFRTRIREGL